MCGFAMRTSFTVPVIGFGVEEAELRGRVDARNPA